MAIRSRCASGDRLNVEDDRRRRIIPAGAYRPDRARIRAARWLALLLGLTVLFSLAPVLAKMHWNLATAPGWARVVVLTAAVQAVCVAWMLAAPDCASVWVVMLLFALVAAAYGMATAVAIATPPNKLLFLGMEDVRTSARSWSAAVLLAMSLATYVCGRTSAKWRRAWMLEMAGRRKG